MSVAEAAAKAADDALVVAHETGRLDLITVLLAAITVLLALGAIYAFFDVRRASKRVARQVANSVGARAAEAVATTYMERELPRLIAQYQELARNAVNAEQANAIAEAQEEH